MLLIYYNINHCCFYQVYRPFTSLKVGSVNGFGHILVQILYIFNNKLYNISSETDIDDIRPKFSKNRFIKRIIRFLKNIE